MPWLKVDDSFPSHPKVRSIPRAARMRALGVWMACGAWSAHHLTDGAIPFDVVDDEGGKQSDARALVTARLWHETGHDCPRCPEPEARTYQFHDWLDWQPAREEVLAKRHDEAQRKADWRAKRRAEREASAKKRPADVPPGQAPDGQRDSGRTDGVSPVPVPDVSQPSRPDPTRPDPTTTPYGSGTGSLAPAARRTTTPPDDPSQVTAQHVTAVWIDAMRSNGVEPTKDLIGQASKSAGQLLAAGNDPAKVLEVAVSAGRSGYAALAHHFSRVNAQPPPPRTRSTTDERFAQAQALKHGPPPGPQLALPGGP